MEKSKKFGIKIKEEEIVEEIWRRRRINCKEEDKRKRQIKFEIYEKIFVDKYFNVLLYL